MRRLIPFRFLQPDGARIVTWSRSCYARIGTDVIEAVAGGIVLGGMRFGSRRDRYLGMTAAIPQVPVPTAIGMLSTVFSSGQMTTYNVYQLKIHEFLSINVILREGYLWQITLASLLIRDICL